MQLIICYVDSVAAGPALVMGQVCVFNLVMPPEQVAMCQNVLPLHLTTGILSQKGPDALIFNGVVPTGDVAPTQQTMIDAIVRELNCALAQHKEKEDSNKTPPSSQTRNIKAPKFGPVSAASDINDRYLTVLSLA